jgi:hypothetical protein
MGAALPEGSTYTEKLVMGEGPCCDEWKRIYIYTGIQYHTRVEYIYTFMNGKEFFIITHGKKL